MRTAALHFAPPQGPLRADELFTAGFAHHGARQVPGDWALAMRAVLEHTRAELLLVDPPPDAAELEALVEPLRADRLDAALAHRRRVPPLDRAVNLLARLSLGPIATDAASVGRVGPLKAAVELGASSDPEALLALRGGLYRFGEAPVSRERGRPPAERARLLATWASLAKAPPPTEGDGHETLRALEAAAPNYNAWLAKTFEPWAGQRILEVGAGIGTITAHLAQGRELVTALEVEAPYIERLKNRFRNQANIEPLQTDVNLADWQALAARRFDTIVLSNVLEHIEDDGAAVQTFAKILPPKGRLLIYVPALPALFGSLDQAVGHYRRYLPSSLTAALEGNGFELAHLRWMNLLGIPGWVVNGRVLGKRSLPPLQLKLFDAVAPALARVEARLPLPVGMNLFAVASRRERP